MIRCTDSFVVFASRLEWFQLLRGVVSFVAERTVFFVLVAAIALSSASPAQQAREQSGKTGKLLLESTAPCAVKIDGGDKGRVVADNPASFVLDVGDHIVSATSDENQTLRKVVSVNEGSQSALVLEFPHITADERAKDFFGNWFAHEEWESKETCRKPIMVFGGYTGKSKMVPCVWFMKQDTSVVISAEQPQDQIRAKFSISNPDEYNNVRAPEDEYRMAGSVEYSVPMIFKDDKLWAQSRFGWDDPEKAQLLTLRIEHSPDGRLAIYQSWTRRGNEPVEPTKPLFVVRK
jgi:hypothetical protein